MLLSEADNATSKAMLMAEAEETSTHNKLLSEANGKASQDQFMTEADDAASQAWSAHPSSPSEPVADPLPPVCPISASQHLWKEPTTKTMTVSGHWIMNGHLHSTRLWVFTLLMLPRVFSFGFCPVSVPVIVIGCFPHVLSSFTAVPISLLISLSMYTLVFLYDVVKYHLVFLPADSY